MLLLQQRHKCLLPQHYRLFSARNQQAKSEVRIHRMLSDTHILTLVHTAEKTPVLEIPSFILD